MRERDVESGRRRFLRVLLAAPIAFSAGVKLGWLNELAAADALLAAASPAGERGPRRGAPPTPECADGDEPTPAETEGPFFKPRSPQRTSLLEPGLDGPRIDLEGRVFSRSCRPLAGALLDFWHADHHGEYDNVGFRLRGHQFT